MEDLFSKFSSGDAIRRAQAGLKERLTTLTETELRGTTEEYWVERCGNEFEIAAPVLLEDQITCEQSDTKADPRNYPSRHHHFSGQRAQLIDATEYIYEVPFSGATHLLYCSGNSYMANFPSAAVHRQSLFFRYVTVDGDVDKIESQFQRDLGCVREQLNQLKTQFAPFNQSIEELVREGVSKRLQKFKQDEEARSKLKYPMKPRQDAPQTYQVSLKPKPLPPKPIQNSEKAEVNYVIEEEHYNNILRIVKNMVLVMERSPKAFKSLNEEAIRFHFLVQLNGQYEGTATGETFNYEGKTDILVRYEGKNLFIGECKFWGGPKQFQETVDQLAGYITWRDTKTAIFIFCRDTDVSTPISKIPEEVKKHPLFDREISSDAGNGEFKYLMKHPQNAQKKFTLSIMIFNVPH